MTIQAGIKNRHSVTRYASGKHGAILKTDEKQFPHPARPVTDPDEVRRMVFCRYYDDCLDVAIRKNWRGFHCMKCRAYEVVDWLRGIGKWDTQTGRRADKADKRIQ